MADTARTFKSAFHDICISHSRVQFDRKLEKIGF